MVFAMGDPCSLVDHRSFVNPRCGSRRRRAASDIHEQLSRLFRSGRPATAGVRVSGKYLYQGRQRDDRHCAKRSESFQSRDLKRGRNDVSADAAVTAANVNVQLPGLNELEGIPSVVNAARELVASMRAAYPDIDFHITGMTPMHNAFAEASVSDMTEIVPLSFALMFVLITFLAGGIIGSIATLLVVAFSVIVAMGLAGYLGFATMNFSEVPPFQEMGTIIAIGVLVSFVLSITFLPALLALLSRSKARKRSLEDNAVNWLGDFVVRRRRLGALDPLYALPRGADCSAGDPAHHLLQTLTAISDEPGAVAMRPLV